MTNIEGLEDWTHIPGQGDTNPEIVVVRPYPTPYEANANKPFVDPAGLGIRRALLRANVSAHFTFACPVYKKGVKPNAGIAKKAKHLWTEELQSLKADGVTRVLMLGADAVRWTDDFVLPWKRHGDIINRNHELNGFVFRALTTAEGIYNSPAQYTSFIEGLGGLLDHGKGPKVDSFEEGTYRTIQSRLQALTALNGMPELVAVDTESTGLDPHTDTLLTIQFSWAQGQGIAMPWGLLSTSEWARILGPRKLVMQNAPHDIKFLAANGVYVSAHEDVMLMHSLVDETPGTHGMQQMAAKYLGVDKWSELIPDYSAIGEVPLNVLGTYGARDTDLTLRLANHFRPQVKDRYIFNVLTRAQNSIVRSELRGVRINRDLAEEMMQQAQGGLHDLKERLGDEYGLENPNSPAQVKDLLLGMGVPLRKKAGKISTAEGAIEPFADSFPVVRDILEYRHLTKVAGTYLSNILEQSERDGRYHPEYRLAATETGRVAEKLITLIPRASGEANPDKGRTLQQRLRELFIPDPGYVMIGADYSTLEVVVLFAGSRDPQGIEDIRLGRDLHGAVAVQAFNLPIDLEPTDTLKERVSARFKHERDVAKTAVFGSIYRGDANTVSRNTGVDLGTAQRVIDTLWGRYPTADKWLQGVVAEAKKAGVISNPWGRRRHFVWSNVLDQRVIAEQERSAGNFIIQSWASDITLDAFAKIEERGVETLYPVHDAIYAQAREDDVERVSKIIKDTMESQPPSDIVPLRADVHVGAHWGEL